MAREKTGAPVLSATTFHRGQRVKWVNTSRSRVTPDYTVWTFHGESVQHIRADVVRRRIDEHGTGVEDIVQDFDDARDSDDKMKESAKAFNEMSESSKRHLHVHTELC